MPANPTHVYTGGCLQPSRTPEEAKTGAVRLAVGTYPKGQVIAQRDAVTAANDVQTLTVTGTPTEGTFHLSFQGKVTALITYSQTDATLQANILAALEALENIGAGNVAVVSSGSGTSVAITFQGKAGSIEQAPLSFEVNGLTGGSSPNASFARTTLGREVGGTWVKYDDARSDGGGVARAVLSHGVTVDSHGFHTASGGEWGDQKGLSAPCHFAGTFHTAELIGLDANGVADLGKLLTGTTSLLSNIATELKIGV
jgi:hypothetical protein